MLNLKDRLHEAAQTALKFISDLNPLGSRQASVNCGPNVLPDLENSLLGLERLRPKFREAFLVEHLLDPTHSLEQRFSCVEALRSQRKLSKSHTYKLLETAIGENNSEADSKRPVLAALAVAPYIRNYSSTIKLAENIHFTELKDRDLDYSKAILFEKAKSEGMDRALSLVHMRLACTHMAERDFDRKMVAAEIRILKGLLSGSFWNTSLLCEALVTCAKEFAIHKLFNVLDVVFLYHAKEVKIEGVASVSIKRTLNNVAEFFESYLFSSKLTLDFQAEQGFEAVLLAVKRAQKPQFKVGEEALLARAIFEGDKAYILNSQEKSGSQKSGRQDPGKSSFDKRSSSSKGHCPGRGQRPSSGSSGGPGIFGIIGCLVGIGVEGVSVGVVGVLAGLGGAVVVEILNTTNSILLIKVVQV